jgi:hypothetical protein
MCSLASSALRRFAAETRASIAVEFIVMVPLILAALIFVYELGSAIWAYEVVSQDVRTAIRYLARSTSGAVLADCTAQPNLDLTGATNLAETGQLASGGTKHFPWNGPSGASIAVVTPLPCYTGYNQPAYVITMTASIPLSHLVNMCWANSCLIPNLTVSVTDSGQFIGD